MYDLSALKRVAILEALAWSQRGRGVAERAQKRQLTTTHYRLLQTRSAPGYVRNSDAMTARYE